MGEDGSVKVFTVFSSPQEIENAEKIKASKYEDAFIGIGIITQRLRRLLLS